MKCVVNWISLRIHVHSRDTQPHLKTTNRQQTNKSDKTNEELGNMYTQMPCCKCTGENNFTTLLPHAPSLPLPCPISTASNLSGCCARGGGSVRSRCCGNSAKHNQNQTSAGTTFKWLSGTPPGSFTNRLWRLHFRHPFTVHICVPKIQSEGGLRVSIFSRPYSVISILTWRSAFCKFRDNLEISFMDTNGDHRIMSLVSLMWDIYVERDLSKANGFRKVFVSDPPIPYKGCRRGPILGTYGDRRF